MLVRACLASMLSCLALSIASAALELPPWDDRDFTSPHPPPRTGLALVLAVARKHLPAYAAAYLTPLLYLYVRHHVHYVYGSWGGVRRALMQRSARAVWFQLPLRQRPFGARTVSGLRGGEENENGGTAALKPSESCGEGAPGTFGADSGSKKLSVLLMATQESSGALTASDASVLAGGGSASSTPPSSSATLGLPSRTDTLDLAASASWHDSHTGRNSGSGRPSPHAPSPFLPFALQSGSPGSAPDPAALAPSCSAPSVTHVRVPVSAQRSGPAAACAGTALARAPGSLQAKGDATRDAGSDTARGAAAAAAADVAAVLLSPQGSTAAAAYLAGTTAAGAAAERVISGIGIDGLLGAGRAPPDPLYSSRLPSSTLVMSCKVGRAGTCSLR